MQGYMLRQHITLKQNMPPFSEGEQIDQYLNTFPLAITSWVASSKVAL
jgi:hypothetical protein